MKKMASAPRSPLSRPSAPQYQPHGRYVLPSRTAARVQSITRAEIHHFWMRKKLEEEEHQLATEETQNFRQDQSLGPAGTSPADLRAILAFANLPCLHIFIFHNPHHNKRINGIIDATNERQDVTKNSKEEKAVTRNIEILTGIKNWYAPVSRCYPYFFLRSTVAL